MWRSQSTAQLETTTTTCKRPRYESLRCPLLYQFYPKYQLVLVSHQKRQTAAIQSSIGERVAAVDMVSSKANRDISGVLPCNAQLLPLRRRYLTINPTDRRQQLQATECLQCATDAYM